jgi:hypothetical protein
MSFEISGNFRISCVIVEIIFIAFRFYTKTFKRQL